MRAGVSGAAAGYHRNPLLGWCQAADKVPAAPQVGRCHALPAFRQRLTGLRERQPRSMWVRLLQARTEGRYDTRSGAGAVHA